MTLLESLNGIQMEILFNKATKTNHPNVNLMVRR